MTKTQSAIATNHGIAYIHTPHKPVAPVKEGGIILVGAQRPAETIPPLMDSAPQWIAVHYSTQSTVVIWSAIASVEVGDRVEFDESLIPRLFCPSCGSTWVVSKGINWHCQECSKGWRKSGNRQVGRPRRGDRND